jgi:broad specificity phosphatase PhoE
MQCLIVQVVFDPALRERHIGDLQGMKFQDAATEARGLQSFHVPQEKPTNSCKFLLQPMDKYYA